MILREVYARFYKSFNYDFLRKNHESAKQLPWEQVDGKWYPYIRVPIEKDITTIVGANESGKSHLLTAIEKGITGNNVNREDFCRYSTFYTVEAGKRRWSDFGFKWTNLNDEDRQAVAAAIGLTGAANFDHFFLFRENKEDIRIFVPAGKELRGQVVTGDAAKPVLDRIPQPFRINADVALPSSVPIHWLASNEEKYTAHEETIFGRKTRVGLLEALFGARGHWTSAETIKTNAASLASVLAPYVPTTSVDGATGARRREAEYVLAKDLICKVAKIDPDALRELNRAIREGLDGHVNGIVEQINKSLEVTLNFPHWWVQDRAFSLRVAAREHDLVFTIRDRTQTDYSFDERSSGLKYFLSYYIQYLAHTPQTAHGEILLMDEPDAYLSSQAQQDLLKVFEAFAHPESTAVRPIQVIYVTHSPFLIDKNHSDRIRVLEKGSGDEGTRVVRNPSRNHYEPLRSSLGAFVAETTFIGNCNLMVEGPADQVLLAGAATYLKSKGVTNYHTLDLNRITIVPAGSATHVPYLVYLARGRDYEKPAVIVLLDSDSEGDAAKKQLLRAGPLKRLKLPENLILQVNDVGALLPKIPSGASRAVDMEDLVPLQICLRAVPEYFAEITSETAPNLSGLTEETIKAKMVSDKSAFDAVVAACVALDPNLHLDKIGFSRAVLRVVHQLDRNEPEHPALKEFTDAMKALFTRLSKMQRDAMREMTQDRVTQRVERAKKAFVQDHPVTARREEALGLFEDIENALDESAESDDIRRKFDQIRRRFALTDDVMKPVERFDEFIEELGRIKYAELLAADQAGRSDDLSPPSGADTPTTAPLTAASAAVAAS